MYTKLTALKGFFIEKTITDIRQGTADNERPGTYEIYEFDNISILTA